MGWIKMRTDLVDDEAVIQIAHELKLEPYAVVGRLHRLWSWADGTTADGQLRSGPSVIDHLVATPGFAASLENAGWLITEDGKCRFPFYERHMSENAKQRALMNRRVSSMREKSEKNRHGKASPEAKHKNCNGSTVTSSLHERYENGDLALPDKTRLDLDKTMTKTDMDASEDADARDLSLVPVSVVLSSSFSDVVSGPDAVVETFARHVRLPNPDEEKTLTGLALEFAAFPKGLEAAIQSMPSQKPIGWLVSKLRNQLAEGKLRAPDPRSIPRPPAPQNGHSPPQKHGNGTVERLQKDYAEKAVSAGETQRKISTYIAGLTPQERVDLQAEARARNRTGLASESVINGLVEDIASERLGLKQEAST